MKPRNKPGGLAVVIGTLNADHIGKQKIGLAVRTENLVPQGFSLPDAWCQSPSGQINRRAGLCWLVIHEPTGRKWLHGDARLLPIDPDGLEDEDQTEKEIENQ